MMVICLLSAWPIAGSRASEPAYDIDVPAMNAAEALNRFAEQTGSVMLYSFDLARTRQANAVRGRYTLLEGLKLLLRDTGLSGGLSDKRVVIIAGNGKLPTGEGESVKKRSLWAGIIAALAGTAAADAKGDQSDESGAIAAKLGEVVVTAQKREERLQNVPISISVLSGDDLDMSTAQGVNELLNRVSGVAITEATQSNTKSISVRGVTAGPLFAGSSPVAYYLDSMPFALVKSGLVPDVNPYDLERVEIVRGPQGTLHGASAQNGVVRVLTKDANLDEFEFKARTSTSSTYHGDWSYRGDAAFNVPIVEKKAAIRAVAGWQDLGGWIDKPNDTDINDAEIANLRLKFNAQPTEELSLGLSAWLSQADYGAPSVASDNGERVLQTQIEEPSSADYDLYGLDIGYEFPAFSLSSATSYLDYAAGGHLDLVIFGAPGADFFTGLEAEVISQEVVLNSTHGGAWRWTVGGIYRDAEDRLLVTLPGFLPVPTDFSQRSQSYAVFGEVTRLFLDGQVELTGGLRYFEDDVTVTENQTALPPLTQVTDTFDEISPRVVLTWHPNSTLTLYSSYAEGFRSGFPQNPTVAKTAPDFPSVDADTLKNYELGAKGSLWDGRLNFDTALYYMDWQEVQSSLLVDVNGVALSALINGVSASGLGLDVGVTAELVEGLTVGGNVSWNDLTLDADVIDVRGTVIFAEGERRSLSPEYTAAAFADYVFPLGTTGFRGRLSVSANYISEQSNRFNAALVGIGDCMLVARTSFSIATPDHWTLTVFADNVNNELDSFIRDPRGVPDSDTKVRPRTIGVQLDYKF